MKNAVIVALFLATPIVLVLRFVEKRQVSRTRKVAQRQGFDWEWQKVQKELKKILGPSAWL